MMVNFQQTTPGFWPDRPAVSTMTYVVDILMLLALGGVMISLLPDNSAAADPGQQQGSRILQAINGVIYAFYGLRLLLTSTARNGLMLLARTDALFWAPVVALLCLACLSLLWSDEPFVAFRRAIGFAGVIVVGCYLALRYSPREFLTLLLYLCAVIIVTSLAMVALYPEKGVMHAAEEFAGLHEGRWRGVFLHKNRLGGMMAMAVVIAAGCLALRSTRVGFVATVLLCAITVLLPAESTTALLACAAGLLSLATARLYRQTSVNARTALPALGPLLLLTVSLAAYQAVENANYVKPKYRLDPATLAPGEEHVTLHRPGFSRDVGATGRFKTWRRCWEQIQDKPLTGYGYGTFWRDGGPAEVIWAKTRFRMPHAHNGWLDLALSLGIPGLLLGAGWMLWLGVRLMYVIWRKNSDSGSAACAVPLWGLFVCINVINLGESVLFQQHDLLSALIISIAVYASTLAHKVAQRTTPARR